MTERWLPVVGFEGAYEVSDEGRVRSLDRVIRRAPSRRANGTVVRLRGRLMSISLDGKYAQVGLGNGNARRVHTLVLEAFVGPCPPGMECRHLDGNKANPRLNNLCWGTPTQNQADRRQHGTALFGERAPGAKLTAVKARTIRADARVHTVIAQDYGVSSSLISQIKTRRVWRHI